MLKLLRPTKSEHSDTTLIAAGTLIEGTIRFSGVLEIEGRVLGDIRCAEANARAVVRVMKGGQVFGNIDVPLVIINGNVTGNIRSSDHIELAAHAVVAGDVYYNLIEMMKGSQVNGSLVFGDVERNSMRESPNQGEHAAPIPQSGPHISNS